MSLLYEKESYLIIGAAIEVHKELGNGFLEAVYQEALEKKFELKTKPAISSEHQAQLLNYLAASRLKLGIIINFGKQSLEHQRIIK